MKRSMRWGAPVGRAWGRLALGGVLGLGAAGCVAGGGGRGGSGAACEVAEDCLVTEICLDNLCTVPRVDGGGAGGQGGAGGFGGFGGGGPGGEGGGPGGEGGGGAGGGGPELVPVTLTGQFIMANNYPSQLHPLYRATFTANSGMTRLALFARFCADAACDTPLAVVQAEIDGADENGRYAMPTASPNGDGFFRAFTVREAPLGASHLQLVGDTQASVEFGKGACTDVSDCPGDVDAVSVQPGPIGVNVSGQRTNPEPITFPLEVAAAGAEVALDAVVHLGHVVFDHGPLRIEPAPDPGRLLVALSNDDDTFRNAIALIDLDDPLGVPERAADSYTFSKNGAPFAGDVCGAVPAGDKLYVIGIDAEGAHVFEVDGPTGVQITDVPVASIPPVDPENAESYPRPCRGVFAQRDTKRFLYLLQFAGAGSLTTSTPYPLYKVDLEAGTITTPFAETFERHALRGIAIDPLASALYVQDQSWSQAASSAQVSSNRLYRFPLDAEGELGEPLEVVTEDTSDEDCGATNNWPAGLQFAVLDGTPRVLAGHDLGITVHDAATLAPVQTLDLTGFGRLISQIEPRAGAEGLSLFAVPQCKAYIPDSDFTLPYGPGTEASDKNLVARLTAAGGMLAVAEEGAGAPPIDINGDGTLDSGIDLDYWHLKHYIRQFESVLPIPPVVYTGARVAVGQSVLAVRGSGIQGNGGNTLSSSGLGQVQDVGLFDLATGHGLIFKDYLPWFDGPSGVWGLDLVPGRESSVGLVHYLR